MPQDARQAQLADLVGRHGRKLRRYLAARLRNTTDAADLVQEVFLRYLRVDRHDKIRSPEAYLFTIASHVLHQHTLNAATLPEAVDVTNPLTDPQLASETDLALELDLQNRGKELARVLEQVAGDAQTCLLLHCREGWTLDEIAVRLGVSRSMVKKHIAKAVLHCRQQMKPPE